MIAMYVFGIAVAFLVLMGLLFLVAHTVLAIADAVEWLLNKFGL